MKTDMIFWLGIVIALFGPIVVFTPYPMTWVPFIVQLFLLSIWIYLVFFDKQPEEAIS